MNAKTVVDTWFRKWKSGNYLDLPLTTNFTHTSPFGTIEGKSTYLDLVHANEDKFLGYTFTIHDGIYEEDYACVRYTARQGAEFKLDVSEWYYLRDGLIEEIISYYHIGEIPKDRRLAGK